jgi:signal transduction histidine kinase/CheY-like chemotaxis protein
VPRPRLRLRTILALLVLATTVPLGLFAARLIWTSWRQQQVLIDRQNIEQARAVSVGVDQEVDRTVAALHVLAELDPVDDPDPTRFLTTAARMLPLHRGWQGLRLIDPSLGVLADTDADSGEPSTVSNPGWVQQVLHTGNPAVSTVFKDPVSGQWVVSVGVPVKRRGSIKHVLGVRIFAQTFSQILNRARLPADGVVALLDTDRRIIARTRNQDRYIGRPPAPDFVENSRSGSEGTWRTTLLEGIPAYSAWVRSPVTGWTVGVGLPSGPVDSPIRRSFVVLIALGVAILGAGIVLATYLSRGIVRTHTSAASAARSLARGEPVTLLRSRIAEADDLAIALGEAAAILQTRMRERDQAQQEVDRNRAALLEQEQAGRRDAEALSRAKDEFVATVSHELRTPLNAIYGWVALLKSGQLDPARHGHALDVIERNTRAQAQLIDDLLDMSRMIRGPLRLEMRPVRLSEVLEAAVDSVRPTAAARQISLSVHAGHEAVVSADPGRLQQVVWNLLANALKFTPAGGHVDASLVVEGSEAVIRITDDGEGIAPEFLPYVFDRFRQETGDITRTHSGLGIGLALVRYLAELHGGNVSAHSSGKGKGSTFSLRLPVPRAGAAKTSRDAAAAVDPSTLTGLHVLVVDDDADARDVVATALVHAGARVTTAPSAAEAMAIAGEDDVHIVLTDIAMPKDSGYDLLRTLRGHPRTARARIVAMTGRGHIDEGDRSLAAGFDGYVGKPLQAPHLIDLLASLAGRSG